MTSTSSRTTFIEDAKPERSSAFAQIVRRHMSVAHAFSSASGTHSLLDAVHAIAEGVQANAGNRGTSAAAASTAHSHVGSASGYHHVLDPALKDSVRDMNRNFRGISEKLLLNRARVQEDIDRNMERTRAVGEAVQILSSESLNTGGALAGKRRASVCGASDAYGGSGDASIDVKMFRMRVLKAGAMRSVGIDVNHEAFNVLSCEPADRFFDAIGRYFLQYMRFLRVHARITALGQLDATKFDGFLTIANADMTEKHPVAVANKVEMQQCFQTLIFEYGQFFMALCEYHDPELERIVLKHMFEITRNVMRITFANYFADIDEQLKEILQYRDARAFHTAHPVEKVRKDDKNDDPSSESTTAAATVKPTVTVMSNPTSPLSAVVAKSKGRAFQVDQRSALIAAAYPTLHELVKECYTKRVGYDDFFPQSLRSKHQQRLRKVMESGFVSTMSSPYARLISVVTLCDRELAELSRIEIE